jgi:mono/diheme cytochrome c family protein
MRWQFKRPFLVGFITGIIVVVIAGGLVSFFLVPLLLKHHRASTLEDVLGTNRVLAAIPRNYKHRKNPFAGGEEYVSSGRELFDSNCAVCHGLNGQGDTPIGKNLFPPAANLTSKKTKSKTDGEIYWIIESGLSFVGMPAFKSQLSDKQIWQMVTYIRALQEGSAGGLLPETAAGSSPKPSLSEQTPTQKKSDKETTTGAAKTEKIISQISPEQGKKIYSEIGCNGCHGDTAQGDVGPALKTTNLSFDVFLKKVRSGGAVMPQYDAKQFPDNEARSVYEWLKSSHRTQ